MSALLQSAIACSYDRHVDVETKDKRTKLLVESCI